MKQHLRNLTTMKQFLIQFRAEVYCQGYEWEWLIMLVEAETFELACAKLKRMRVPDWEKGTPELFKNLTV